MNKDSLLRNKYCTILEITAEFKIRNGQYTDKWLNTSTSVWPFTKVYDHFI